MAEHGRLYSKDFGLYAHGNSTTHNTMADVKEHIKRKGYTRGTVTPKASYLPLDAEGNESHTIPLVWEDTGPSRPFEVTKRGAFKWADTLAVVN